METVDPQTTAAGLSLWRMSFVLSINLFNGFVFDALAFVATAAQIQIFAPNSYALLNSVTIILGAAAQASGFVFGHISDKFGRRPVLLAGTWLLVMASIIMVASVHMSTTAGLATFMGGYVLTRTPARFEREIGHLPFSHTAVLRAIRGRSRAWTDSARRGHRCAGV